MSNLIYKVKLWHFSHKQEIIYLEDGNMTQLGLSDNRDLKPNGQLISDLAVASSWKQGTYQFMLQWGFR